MQADMTRVASFMIGREVSGRSYPEIGVPDAHHPLSHHGNDPEKIAKLTKINTLHMEQVAYYLKRMSETKEGEGSLLDNTLVHGRRQPGRSQPPRPSRPAGDRGRRADQGRSPRDRRQGHAHDQHDAVHDGHAGRGVPTASATVHRAAFQLSRRNRQDDEEAAWDLGLCLLLAALPALPAAARTAGWRRRCKSDDHAAIKRLLAAHANVNAPLPDKSTVLAWAVDRQDVEIGAHAAGGGRQAQCHRCRRRHARDPGLRAGQSRDRHRPAQGRRRRQGGAGRRHRGAGAVRRHLHARGAGRAGRQGRQGECRRSARPDRPDVGGGQGPHRQYQVPAGAWRQCECGLAPRASRRCSSPCAARSPSAPLALLDAGAEQQGRAAGRHLGGRGRGGQ